MVKYQAERNYANSAYELRKKNNFSLSNTTFKIL